MEQPDLERGVIAPPPVTLTPVPPPPPPPAPDTHVAAPPAQDTHVAAAPPPPAAPPAQDTHVAAPLTLTPAAAPPLTLTPVAAQPATALPLALTPAAAPPLALTPVAAPPPLALTPVAAPPPAAPPPAQETPEKEPPPPQPERKKWLPQVKKALGLLSKDDTLLNHGIYTVPARLKSTTNDDALSPRIVSIGPFHRGKPGLLAMHEQKLIYLSFLLHRTLRPVEVFDHCCNSISSLDRFKIYAENVGFSPASPSPDRDPDKIVEITLIDVCFVIELLLRFWKPSLVDPDDPIFNNNWIISTLQHDLLLLENQIPFFVLEIVFKIVTANLSDPANVVPDLETLARGFFGACLKKLHYAGESSRPLHFLDMLHHAYVLPAYALYYQEQTDGDNDQATTVLLVDKEIAPVLKSSTQQLLAAGVKIEKSTKHLLDVSFENQTLKIPPLLVDRKAWSILKNLVVLEQCSVARRHHVTSYAVVLRNLIRSRRDVELLEERGILVNDLDGGQDGVLGFVECVGSGVVIREFLYGKLFERLNEFRVPWWCWRKREASWKLGWHRSIMVLRTDYFSNRWRVVQFAAAVLLLLLTALQTYYTVLGYY